MRRALFGVKLCRKNVVPGYCARKKSAIVGFSGNMRCIFRFGVEAMHKIKVTVARYSFPQRMGLRWSHLVPTHLWYFEATAVGLGSACQIKFDDLPGNQTQS